MTASLVCTSTSTSSLDFDTSSPGSWNMGVLQVRKQRLVKLHGKVLGILDTNCPIHSTLVPSPIGTAQLKVVLSPEKNHIGQSG